MHELGGNKSNGRNYILAPFEEIEPHRNEEDF